MGYDFQKPNYWFDRAEEMRARADLMRDLGNKEIMLRIADDYDWLGYRVRQLPKRTHTGNTTVSRHPVFINARRTSISLENEFWRSLHEIAVHRNKTVSQLVEQIDHERDNPNLSSAVRLFIFNHLKMRRAAK